LQVNHTSDESFSFDVRALTLNFGITAQYDQRVHQRSISIQNRTDKSVTITVVPVVEAANTSAHSVFTLSCASQLIIGAMQTTEVLCNIDTNAINGRHECGYTLRVANGPRDARTTAEILVTADIQTTTVSAQPATVAFGCVCKNSDRYERAVTLRNHSPFDMLIKASIVGASAYSIDQYMSTGTVLCGNATISFSVCFDSSQLQQTEAGYVAIAVGSGMDILRIPVTATLVEPCFALLGSSCKVDAALPLDDDFVDFNTTDGSTGITITASSENLGLVQAHTKPPPITLNIANTSFRETVVHMSVALGALNITGAIMTPPIECSPWSFTLQPQQSSVVILSAGDYCQDWCKDGGSTVRVIASAAYSEDFDEDDQHCSAWLDIGALFVPKVLELRAVEGGCISINTIKLVNRSPAALHYDLDLGSATRLV
jgi:hypothetical protein